jgi:hypothetical protein
MHLSKGADLVRFVYFPEWSGSFVSLKLSLYIQHLVNIIKLHIVT